MRVAIDATPLLVQPTGVGSFVRGLTGGLLRDHSLDLTGYAISARNGKQLKNVLPPQVQISKRRLAAAPLLPLWKRVRWPSFEWFVGSVDVMHGTNVICPPTSAATVMTIHDLTSLRFPELCVGVARDYPTFIRKAIERGAFVHTPSAFIASEVREHFSVEPERVVAIPHGAPKQFEVQEDQQRTMFELTKGAPYVLAVGTIEPRKDYPTLVRAFAGIADSYEDVLLVIAGAPGWSSEEVDNVVSECKLEKRVIRLGYVEERFRSALFENATVFVYPSLYEGFGIPPLEAMHARTPVIATRAGAVPEICGDAAFFIDVGDVNALSEAIHQTLTDESLRAQLVEAGKKRVSLYDWTTTAQHMASLYATAQGNKSG
jgi:glycosyltransferase involved in cell wall biosynthesis